MFVIAKWRVFFEVRTDLKVLFRRASCVRRLTYLVNPDDREQPLRHVIKHIQAVHPRKKHAHLKLHGGPKNNSSFL
jgi:hypothetical protein